MLLTLPELVRRGSTIHDVVIVGSGPAAIATAYALEQQGVASTLLESGEADKSEEWNVRTEGFLPADYGVAASYPQLHIRRELGGGMSVWGGWCSAMRETSFARPDIPAYPGWPIRKTDLIAHYRRAGEFLKIAGAEQALVDAIPIGQTGLTAKPFRFSPPVRFADFRDHIAESKKITLVTGATVVGLKGFGGHIDGVNVRYNDGAKTLSCRSSVVLAGGAVGNARIIALSANVGISSNSQSFVGKYLFEHPHCYSLAKVVFAPHVESLVADRTYWSDRFISLAPSQEFLTHQRVTDFNFQLWPIGDGDLGPRELAISKNYELIYGVKAQFYNATLGMEQASHIAANSVLDNDTLEHKNDGHLVLDLSVQEKVIAVARKWLISCGLHAWVSTNAKPSIVAVGHLHGTTRMAADDKNGVVDINCRVFGMRNLFVAGSSVFPTAGFTNPTFTIAALALRLGDYLAKEAT